MIYIKWNVYYVRSLFIIILKYYTNFNSTKYLKIFQDIKSIIRRIYWKNDSYLKLSVDLNLKILQFYSFDLFIDMFVSINNLLN